MATAEENQQWVQNKIAEAGLTEQVELEALQIIEARQEMEGL